MIKALFTSDLHSSLAKYEFLFSSIIEQEPEVVFITGDLIGLSSVNNKHLPEIYDLLHDYVVIELKQIREKLKDKYPQIFVILGNDDSKAHEAALLNISTTGLLTYVNQRIVKFLDYSISGYSYIPPTPFLNKDWEKYDVSRFVDVGCVSPEEGYRSIPITSMDIQYNTIKRDLEKLFSDADMSRMICLFHAPPYDTALDRADLDGKFVDHAPLDVHVGSIAIKEFIVGKNPYITLHGHVHESTRMTGIWKEKINNTVSFQGASEKNDLFLIKFDLEDPENAEVIYKSI